MRSASLASRRGSRRAVPTSKRRTSFEDMNCSIAKTLKVIGERWTLLIVRDGLVSVTRCHGVQ